LRSADRSRREWARSGRRGLASPAGPRAGCAISGVGCSRRRELCPRQTALFGKSQVRRRARCSPMTKVIRELPPAIAEKPAEALAVPLPYFYSVAPTRRRGSRFTPRWLAAQ
jgi:hypothetical protein